MKYSRLLASAGAILLVTMAASADQATPAAPADKPASSLSKLVPPVRGEAQLGMTAMVTKRAGNEVVTTFKVKNMSATNSIVGLKIDEFYYDKGGNPVTGDTYRHKKPLAPQEVIEVTFHTPVDPKMYQSQYKFAHANGNIKTTKVPKM